MWFTNYRSIGRIDDSGTITRYDLPNQNSAAARITLGPDNALWFTENSPDAIGRITTEGIITEYPLPNSNAGVRGIAAGPDGALWFTEWSGGKIGRITITGIITEYALSRFASTDWIVAGPDGAMWFTEENEVGGGGHIGRITTEGTITEYLLPAPVSDWHQWGFTGIAAGPDGALWVTEWVGHRILRVTTFGSVTEYNLDSCPMTTQSWICADPIIAGTDGALWFALFSANKIGRITTTGAMSEYPIPTANSQVSGMASGADGSIWFTEHASGKIGRIVFTHPDTTPPAITFSVNTKTLWPPNGQMVPVTVRGTIQDADSGMNDSSVGYEVIDEYREVQPSGHMALDSAGNYSFTVLLRASCDGKDKDGRIYQIQVRAQDNAGNRAVKWSNVIVPHDQRR